MLITSGYQKAGGLRESRQALLIRPTTVVERKCSENVKGYGRSAEQQRARYLTHKS
jgi:hypothetical protein